MYNLEFNKAASGGASTNKVGVSSGGTLTYYADPAAALSAASSGDVMYVYDGVFDQRNLLKNGVDQWWAPGTGVTYTGSDAGAIFDDTSTGQNGNVTCTIAGHGEFIYSGTGSASGLILDLDNTSSVTMTCSMLKTTVAKTAVYNNDATAVMRIHVGECSFFDQGFKNQNGTMYLDVGHIDMTGANTTSGGFTSSNGNMYIKLNTGTITSTSAPYLVYGGSGNMYLEFNTLYGADDYSRFINATGSGTMVIKGNKILATATNLSDALVHANPTGKLILEVNEIEGKDQNEPMVEVSNNSGTVIVRNTRILNMTASAGTNPAIQIDGNGTHILENCTLYSDIGTESIDSNGDASTIQLHGNTYANVAADADAIFTVGNFIVDSNVV